MFYTIHWPIPVEVLVRIKYPMCVVLSPFDSRKSDGGNTLHVATICLATQLFLSIVDFQQYFCHIECDGYDVEN